MRLRKSNNLVGLTVATGVVLGCLGILTAGAADSNVKVEKVPSVEWAYNNGVSNAIVQRIQERDEKLQANKNRIELEYITSTEIQDEKHKDIKQEAYDEKLRQEALEAERRSGVGHGTMPDGTPTISALLSDEISRGLISSGSPGVQNRGRTKSMMGWQCLGGSHHNMGGTIKGYGAPQWAFVIGANTGNHNFYACEQSSIVKSNISAFDENGFGFVNGRYIIALKEDFGKYAWGEKTQIGDAVDVYLDDDTVIHAYVGDFKGHENASNIVHSDGSIIEFVVDVRKFYGCCNGTGRYVEVVHVKPEFDQPIKGIVKVGNWFDE